MVFLFQKGARAPFDMLEHALNHAISKRERYSLFLSWQSPIITEERKQFFQLELSKYTQIQSFLETCLSLPPSLPQLQSEAEALQQAETIEAQPTTLLSFQTKDFLQLYRQGSQKSKWKKLQRAILD